MRGERGVGEGELDIVMDKVRDVFIVVVDIIIIYLFIHLFIYLFIYSFIHSFSFLFVFLFFCPFLPVGKVGRGRGICGERVARRTSTYTSMRIPLVRVCIII